MLAYAGIEPWHYGAFILAIIVFLALDLGVFHRKQHVVEFKEAIGWTTLWFMLAMLFAILVVPGSTQDNEEHPRMAFITGYILELSLSMDNVFVIALIFSYFRVKPEYQHRLLFWGILGAIIMRGIMIGIGAAAVAKWHWILYIFGAFLLYTGVKLLLTSDDEGVEPEKNFFVKLARRIMPVHEKFDGGNFITEIDGRRMLTPMAIALITIESTDVVFAVDSIPAIFAVTRDPFIIFTSNMFAILGLRSLYFVLANAIGYFQYLRYGLALVLTFIGAKMLAEDWWKTALGKLGVQDGQQHFIPLVIVIIILFVSILASMLRLQNNSGEEDEIDEEVDGDSPQVDEEDN
ncbi:MAG: hypothetical protein CMO64_07750 [Verrucomicrobiales bacterium]|nr:hypothetical protein [Verrucomicrobiales bacterium]